MILAKNQPYAVVSTSLWAPLSVELPIYGATKRVRSVPKWGARDACERSHWGFRWSFLWGHETCEGCDEMGAGRI